MSFVRRQNIGALADTDRPDAIAGEGGNGILEVVEPNAPVSGTENVLDDAPDPAPPQTETSLDSGGDDEAQSRIWEDTPSRGPSIGNLRPEMMPILDGSNWHRLPMCAADGGKIGSWWLSAASIGGISHVATGRTRQDDYCYALLPDGSLVSVVTDGLGSYKDTAQLGAGLMARTFVQVAYRLAAEGLDDDLLGRSLGEAQDTVADLGERVYELSREQLSCTLVACLLPVDGPAEFVRVGDAEAFTLADGGEFESVFGGLEDALVNMVAAACPRARPQDVERMSGARSRRVVLASDGLAGDIRLSKALRTFLDEEWEHPTSAALMLDTLRYRRQGSHDDRTGLVAWRLDAG